MEKKTKIISLLYEAVVFLLMLTAILIYRPAVFLYIPLLVSVVVMLLQARVNRYAFLVGAINSLLYAVAYVQMSLYATALYAAVVSCPIQLLTFFNWQRHTQKSRTTLRSMTGKTRALTAAAMVGGFLLLYLVFFSLGSEYLLLDNIITILGVVSSILCLLRYSEYVLLQIVSSIVSLCTFLLMLKSDPSRIIWVINSTNTMISACVAWRNIKMQKRKK